MDSWEEKLRWCRSTPQLQALFDEEAPVFSVGGYSHPRVLKGKQQRSYKKWQAAAVKAAAAYATLWQSDSEDAEPPQPAARPALPLTELHVTVMRIRLDVLTRATPRGLRLMPENLHGHVQRALHVMDRLLFSDDVALLVRDGLEVVGSVTPMLPLVAPPPARPPPLLVELFDILSALPARPAAPVDDLLGVVTRMRVALLRAEGDQAPLLDTLDCMLLAHPDLVPMMIANLRRTCPTDLTDLLAAADVSTFTCALY